MLLALSEHQGRARSLYLEALDLATGLEDPDIEADVLLRAQVGLSDPEDLDRRRYAAQRCADHAT